MTQRYADYNKDYPARKDDTGMPLCRWCGKQLRSKRCSAMCSEQCREEVLVRIGHDVRSYVRKRDKGICVKCGIDCAALSRRLEAIWQHHSYRGRNARLARLIRSGWHRDPKWERLLRRVGLSDYKIYEEPWDAHHKVAVNDGGGCCGLDGFETLCIWCHKIESAKQKARWAAERKTTAQTDDPQMTLPGM